jgi:hypothetical protein
MGFDNSQNCWVTNRHVLSRGDIEAYVGLRKASKEKYLNAVREIESGEIPLNFKDELRGIYSKIGR